MIDPNPATGYSERLYNEDLAPPKERTWTGYRLFAMWMVGVQSIGGYTFAARIFFLLRTLGEIRLWEGAQDIVFELT